MYARPPRRDDDSISKVDFPCAASRRAAPMPAAPPPTIMTSNWLLMRLYVRPTIGCDKHRGSRGAASFEAIGCFLDLQAELLERPLRRTRRSWLHGRNGRKAERPVLRALSIQHDVSWPKAVWQLSVARGAKPDTAAFSLPATDGYLFSTFEFPTQYSKRIRQPRRAQHMHRPRLLKNFPFICIAERATYR